MSGPTLHTADAGQAYEMAKPKIIEKAFAFVFDGLRRLTKRADPLVSVMHTAKSKTKNGGWISDRLSDRSVFFLSKIEKCMKQLLKCRYYQFGNKFCIKFRVYPSGGR